MNCPSELAFTSLPANKHRTEGSDEVIGFMGWGWEYGLRNRFSGSTTKTIVMERRRRNGFRASPLHAHMRTS